MNAPKIIHDFGGFPKALFDVQYPSPGSPKLAKETTALVQSVKVELDHDWGLGHGAWSIVKQMYPQTNIPVLQLSIDYNKPAAYHYELAKEMAALRKKGVLILASGNMIHNLRMIHIPNGSFSDLNTSPGFDWAVELNEVFKKHIADRNHRALMNYEQLGAAAKMAIPTPDHYYPLMYALALQEQKEDTVIFNDKVMAGSMSMTSVRIG